MPSRLATYVADDRVGEFRVWIAERCNAPRILAIRGKSVHLVNIATVLHDPQEGDMAICPIEDLDAHAHLIAQRLIEDGVSPYPDDVAAQEVLAEMATEECVMSYVRWLMGEEVDAGGGRVVELNAQGLLKFVDKAYL